MPFHRKTKFVRRYHRKAPRARQIARIATRAVAKVAETKFQTISLSTTFSTLGASWVDYNFTSPISNGSTNSQRVGNKISITGIYIRGIMSNGASGGTGDPYNVVRMVLGYYDSPGAAAPMAAAGLGMSDQITKECLPTLIKLYRDKYIVLRPVIADGPAFKTVQFYLRFKRPIILQFNGSAVASNNRTLALSFLSDSSVAPSPKFINGFMNIYFKDL